MFDKVSDCTTIALGFISLNALGTGEPTQSMDVSNYPNGIVLSMLPTQSVDPTAFISVGQISESDDNSTWSEVPSYNIIGDLTELQSLSVPTSFPLEIPKVGVLTRKKYLRAEINNTNSPFGTISCFVWATSFGRLIPEDLGS